MLCTVCDALGLSADDFIIGSLDRISFYDKYHDLGTVAAVRERAVCCSLCRITLETVGLGTTSSKSEVENTSCALFWQGEGFVQGDEEPQKRFLRVSVEEWPEDYPEFHRICLLVDDPHGRIDPLFLGRRIPDKINIKQVRKWIRSCERWHEVVCAGPVSILNHPFPTDFRVIDTWQLCVSNQGIGDLTYLALSYVWGDPSTAVKLSKHNIMEMQQPGALRQDRIHLPRTIRDAMNLTSCLSFRYLWVDSLCIVQDDTADKAKMLSVMDNIYDRAFLTIIAATGQDSSAGLPGLRKSSRGVQQRIENLKPGLGVASPKHLSDALEQSYYDTRGWTYQERMLSTRRLYFIDGQVIFHCRSAVYREDINLENWKITACQDEVGYRFREGLKSSSEPQNVYAACVWEYSSRKLSHDDDVVNAFEGLVKIIVKMFIEVYPNPLIGASSICGLPTPCFDWALLWTIQAPMVKRRKSLWPSWSWCGWTGKVSFVLSSMEIAALFEWLSKETWIKWMACEQRTGDFYMAQVNCSQGRSPYFPAERYPPVKVASEVEGGTKILTKHRLQDLCSFKLLHFATLAMTFRVQYAEKHRGSSYQYDICASDGIACGTVWLEADVHSGISRSFEFLALSAVTPAKTSSLALPVHFGQNRNDRGGYHVLMVSYRESDEPVERLGLGLVLQESMNEERGAVWKEVWLQ